jgi:arylsulfatase
VILSDDIGYSDIGCFGSEIKTPNLDRLAGNGLRYTQFHNTPRSSPTRASLLTGLYSHQAGMGHLASENYKEPGYVNDLSKNAVTMAEVFKQAGYSTYMTGKWHISMSMDPGGDRSNWPLQRGFDRYFGTLNGSGSYYDPEKTSITQMRSAILLSNILTSTRGISHFSFMWHILQPTGPFRPRKAM